MKKSTMDLIGRIVVYALLIVVSVLFLLPFLWMVSTALKPIDKIFTIPPQFIPRNFMWQNFTDAINAIPFWTYLNNTLIYAVFSMLGTVLSSNIRQFMMSIPKEMSEAARIDGASEWGILWRIIVPITKPALLDLDEPWKVIYRASDYLLSPQKLYECVGDVPNVVFPTAALYDAPTGRIAIYYGAADTVTCLAFAKVDEVIDFIKSNNTIK